MSDYMQNMINLNINQVTGIPIISWDYTPESFSIEGANQILNEAGQIRIGQSRSSFRSNGRYWTFYFSSNWLRYNSSEDGVIWNSEVSLVNSTEPLTFSIKYDDGNVYLIYGKDLDGYHHFWKGVPAKTGVISWITQDKQLPPRTGFGEPTPQGAAGNPDVCVNSSGIPYAAYCYYEWVVFTLPYWPYTVITYKRCMIFLNWANDVNGNTWQSQPTMVFIGSFYGEASKNPCVAFFKLNSNKLLLVYDGPETSSTSIRSYYFNGTSWSNITLSGEYYYLSDYGLQSIADGCQNVYACWVGRDISYNIKTLNISVFNINIGYWTTIELLSSLDNLPYQAICKEKSDNNLHVYYVTGNSIYRISIMNNLPGEFGTVLSPQLIVSESGPITELEVADYSIEEYTGVYRSYLTYVVGGTVQFVKDIIPYTTESVELVEIYRKDIDEEHFESRYEIYYPENSVKEVGDLENGTYYYALRIKGAEGTYFDFQYVDFTPDITLPQIELAGRGGYNSLRHSIYTFHDSISPEKNIIRFKIWNTEYEDASKDPGFTDPGIIMNLKASEEIETKNVEPFLTDTFVTGSELNMWKEIYSVISKTDKNVSAKLRLWNGR